MAHKCLAMLEETGTEVEMITDFERAEAITREIGKPGLQPKMALDYNDFTEESAFWMFLKEDGKYIASVAARIDDVGRESMESYFKRTFARHYPHGSGEAVRGVSKALPQDFCGPMAYSGELFINETSRGSRKKLRAFILLFQVNIFTKWKVDWHYAFMRERDVHRGLASVYGFTHQVPGIFEWCDPAPSGRGDQEWLVAVPAGHLEHMFKYYSQSVERLSII